MNPPLPSAADGQTKDWSELAFAISDLAGRLATDGWDRMCALRLAHQLRQAGSQAVQWHDLRQALMNLEGELEHQLVAAAAPAPERLAGWVRAAKALAQRIVDGEGFVVSAWEPGPVQTLQLPVGWRLRVLGPPGTERRVLWCAGHAGIEVAGSHANLDEIIACLDAGERCVVLVELSWLHAQPGLTEAIGALLRRRRGELGCVAITEAEDFATQLATLRAGIDIFLEKPVTPERLLARLEGSLWPPEQPYRVMLVDDDAVLLDYVASLLREAGMAVAALADPLQVLEFIEEFAPEVLVMDIEMPACLGTELVTLLRQKAAYADLPVIYLTAYGDHDHSQAARLTAGEEFLTKPVEPATLITAVTVRAQRARHLRAIEDDLRRAGRQFDRLRHAIDQHAIVSVADRQGRIIYVNSKFCEISGYRPEELLGQNHRLLKSDEHGPEFFERMWRTISAGRVWHGEIKNRRKNGQYYWVQSSIVPFIGEDGRPEVYVSIRTEITEQRFQRELTEVRASIMQHAPSETLAMLAHVAVHSQRLLAGSRIAIVLLDAAGQRFELGVGPDLAEDLTAALARAEVREGAGSCGTVAATGQPLMIEDVLAHPYWAGDYAAMAAKMDIRAAWSQPIFAQNGRLVGVFNAFFREPRQPEPRELLAMNELARMTGTLLEWARQEQALREREAKLSNILNTASEGFWRINREDITEEVNPMIGRILGHPGSAMLGRSPEVYVAPASREAMAMALSRLHAGERFEGDIDFTRSDGVLVSCNVRAVPLFDKEGRYDGAFAMVTDITERKRQAALLELLRAGMANYVEGHDLPSVAEHLLAGLLELSGSEYGFIGEVLRDDTGARYLKTHALSNIAWDEASRRLYEENAARGFEFRNLDTLFGAVIRSGEAVISNDPAKDPRRGGRLPPGHPPLKSFLGVPIYHGAELVGMYGLANRPGGYDEAALRFFAPFNTTYGAIIEAHRAEQRQQAILDALRVARDQAESASRAKSNFLASMSHELRTPLNAILGFAQLIEFDDSVSDDTRAGAQEIERAGKHLLELVNELLDLAKIEAGQMDVNLGPVAAEDALRECRAMAAGLVRDPTLRLEFDLDSARGCVVQADPMRLRQALLNLVSNAIKYNRPGGSVHVACQAVAEGRLRFVVRDTGPGIAPENHAKLFSPFERLGAERGNIHGTGIGLVITRRLVELMHGQIGLTSVPGEGSEFWIELSCEPASARARQAKTVHTVLYIEDSPMNVRLMQGILAKRRDIRLICAANAEDGLRLARQERPNLIFMDINLPGMNGYEAMARLQAEPALRDVPVVAITAHAMRDERQRGLAQGFAEYLTKPFELKVLNAILERMLQAPPGGQQA